MKKIYSFVVALAVSAFSMTVSAQNELVVGDVKVGDKITLSDGSEWYVGANEIENPSFSTNPADNSNNIVGWHVGNYAQMTTSNFAWHESGGYDGGAYIQAIGHTGSNGASSVCQRWSIEPNTRYYLSFYLAGNSANNRYIPVITLTDKESTGGGQNEKSSEGALQLIGKNGEDSGTILGYGNFLDSNGDGVGEWCQTACSFESSEYTYCQFNARWLKENKIQACFDGFFLAKLYDPATTSAEKVAEISLLAMLSQAESAQENDLADYPALAEELSEWIMNSGYDSYTAESNTLEEIQTAIDAIKTKMTAVTSSVEIFRSLETAMEDAYSLYESTSYPGQDAFGEVIQAILDYQSDGYFSLDPSMPASEYVNVALKQINDAVATYRFSQEASEDNPADYTFYVDNPTFVAKGNWYIGQTGGDQRLHTGLTDNAGNSMTAWNAWRGDLSSESASVSISQDLTGLPNGKYIVTADMMTQDGCITDQHVYASASASTAESPVMTQTGWDPYVWETLSTTPVIVVDGNLTIGAIGHGVAQTAAERGGSQSDYRCGWFCISNFKLSYLGEASEEEYATAIASKVAEAKEFAETMHYAGDKATFQAAIEATKTAADLVALNEAYTVAQASETDYASVIAGSYKLLSDTISTDAYTANAKKVAQVPVDYMTNYLASAEATYTETGNITTVIRYYLYTLVPTLIEAETTEFNDATGKAAVEGTVANVVSKLGSYISNTTVLAAYVQELETALSAAEQADIQYGDGADVTAYIKNASINDAYVTGWNLIKVNGDGNGAKYGQASDGISSNYYIDSYNSTAGKVAATYYQVLNVPNGTYELSAEMRNSGGGFYLFASNAAPTLNADSALVLDPAATNAISLAKVVNTPAKYIVAATEEENGMTDTYGAIWMAAADKIMDKFGITGAINADETTGTEAMSIYDQVIEANEGNTTCPEGIDEADWAAFCANNGIGRGWFNNSLQITVDNHVLCLGVTCDSVFTEGLKDVDGNLTVPFTGYWFSTNNFKLTMVKEGSNADWNPATAIEAVDAAEESDKIVAVYSLAGVRQNGLQKGVNIVKYANGTSKKVLLK